MKHLHEHPGEQALWLDTTASFSAEWGSQILQSIIQSSEGQTSSIDTQVQEDEVPISQAPTALDRLIVAKVFDLQSAIQAIQQIRSQGQAKVEDEAKRAESQKVDEADMAEDPEATIYSNEVPETGRPAVTLLQSSAGLSAHSDEEQDTTIAYDKKSPTSQTTTNQLHLRFIVIDTVTALLKGVLNATSAEGHARMLSFMRLLRTLTTPSTASTSKTTIFVINNFVALASTANSTAALHSVFPALNAKRYKAALGPTFTYLTDWTIYLSQVRGVFPQYGLGDDQEGEANRQEKLIFEVVRSRRMVSSSPNLTQETFNYAD